MADFFRRPAKRAHGDDDTENSGDDAKARQRVRHGGKPGNRQASFVVVDIHIEFHHLVDIEGFNAATGGHANGVANKMLHVMILEEAGIFGKHRTLFGIVAIGFQRHQAFLAGAGEKLKKHFHYFHVTGLVVLRAPKNSGEAASHLLEDVERVGDEHSARGGATNDDEFGGLDEHFDIAVLHQVAAENGSDNDDDSDNHEHG